MDDLIRRQAAIYAVHKEFDECLVWDESGEITANEVERILEDLPSIPPEAAIPKEWDETYRIASNIRTLFGIDTAKECWELVRNHEIERVRHGKWIRNDNGTYSCSLCQSWIPEEQYYYARFCLHCGALMKVEE